MKIAPLVLIREDHVRLALVCTPFEEDFWEFRSKFCGALRKEPITDIGLALVGYTSDGMYRYQFLRQVTTGDLQEDMCLKIVSTQFDGPYSQCKQVASTIVRAKPLIKAWMKAGLERG